MAYPAHMQFWCNVGRNFKLGEVAFFSPRRMSIDRMRNEAARQAVGMECDYLFFYDDDVILPDDCLEVLIKTAQQHTKLVVGGLTLVRGYPFNPMIFRYQRTGDIYTMTCYKDYEKNVNEHGFVDCDALGFSCCLIDVNALKMLQPPYFVTGENNTEDVYFCHKINTETELEKPICVQTKIPTSHLLDQYAVSPANKQHFVRLEKGLYNRFPGTLDKDKNRHDRDAEYREQVMERLRRAQASM